MAIAGGPQLLPPHYRDHASDVFADTLQGALEQADDSSSNMTAIDRRPQSHRGPDSDTDDSAADKDTADQTSPTDAVTVGRNDELIRTQPEPPPADQSGTSATSGDEQVVTETPGLSEALSDLAHAAHDGTASTTNPTTTGEVGRQTARRDQSETRNRNTDQARSLAEIDGEVTSNLASMLQQMASGSESGQQVAMDSQLTEREWRQAMVEKLSNLIEPSPSDRSNKAAGSRASVPQLPAAAGLSKALAAMVNQASEERGSTAANAGAVSGIGELFEAGQSSSFDRRALSQFNQVRIEPSMVAPLRLASDAIGTTSAPIEQRPIDTDLPEQIVQSIRLQALDLGSEARVRLRPGYLGEVVVSVKVDAGAVTATLQADTPAVRRWIEKHEASLRIGLADHGLHLDRLIVSEPAKSESEPEERRRQPQQEQAAREQSRRPQPKPEESGTFEVVV